ncbi:MAG: AAA family ATPase [Lentisphaeria bacterium]|nr:AAA family ATPase [Lentisphaeria bacterium]
MKILKVRLQNLNSLVGEWRIDFTHPDYSGNGIFAITGPTGAGKSTILDAICLALFGRTPRLERVNQSANDIMSRHCGECLAEVEFSTLRGHYRCTWSQRRARGKADGKLQQQKHEIADLNSDKLLETKLLAVIPKVEEVTGMNFERFTRSMLLAQGSFAAFLQADPDKRSPILEGITGTSVYTEISELVHQRNSEEKQKLERLAAELSGVTLLSDDEVGERRNALATTDSEIAELDKQITALQAAIGWHQQLAKLKHDLTNIEPEKEKLTTATAAFAADRERLAAALRALECDAKYGNYAQLRTDLNNKTAALAVNNERLPELQDQADLATATAEAATKQYQAVKAEQIALVPELSAARKLDSKINDGKNLLATTEGRLAEIANGLDEQQKCLAKANTTLTDKTWLRTKLESDMTTGSADGGLVGQLAAISDKFTQLRQARKALEKASADLGKAEHVRQEADKDIERDKKVLADRQTAAEATEAKLTKAESALERTLRGQTQRDWQEQRLSLQGKLSHLQQALVGHATYVRLLNDQADCRQTCDSLQKSIASLTTTLGIKVDVCQTQTALVNSLEETFHAAKLIADYEQARRELADGKPCPLCGATDHPFAKGNIPVPSTAKQQLDAAKKKLNELDKEKQRLEIELNGQRRDKVQAEDRLKALGQELPTAVAQLNELCATIAPDGSLTAETPALNDKFTVLTQELKAKMTEAASVIDQAAMDAKAVDSCKKEVEDARAAVLAADKLLSNAKTEAEKAKLGLQSKAEACTSAQQRLDECRQQALGSIKPFGYDAISEDRLDGIYSELQQRRDNWQRQQQDWLKLEKEIPALTATISECEKRCHELADEQTKKKSDLATQQRDLAELQASRADVLGGKAAEDEEKRVANELEGAETKRDNTIKHRQDCQHKLQEIETFIHNLQNDISELKANTTRAEEAFHQAISTKGFADEAAFLAARLPELEREALQKKDKDLTQRATELACEEKRLREQLAAEEKKALSNEPRESLESQRTAQTTAMQQLHEKSGALRQELNANDQAKEKHRDKTASLETQRQSCAKWEMLHDLIGSSDGKKFRDFAQGLTFEIVIKHANAQLRKMSDRYLLTRDRDNPLELNVIDNYQADAIRSTKNLSGGESFIVSLALALGLSNMASKNVRIDSLFLDEGFGALDEEALESALDALAGLQHEGKVIGVISHVVTLKDRITTQIQVSPIVEGRSRLDGPGCTRGHSKKAQPSGPNVGESDGSDGSDGSST